MVQNRESARLGILSPDKGSEDCEIPNHKWSINNFFWFKKQILVNGRQLSQSIWSPNGERTAIHARTCRDGMGGLAGPDAIVLARVQKELLKSRRLKIRAAHAGAPLQKSVAPSGG